MPRPLPAPLAAVVLALLGACTPRAVIPEPERAQVSAQLTGQPRWLRVAMYAAPFWGDRTKVLLTDTPLDELDLVETTGGAPVAPPPAERILPPGTAVKIREVEFPTGWMIAQRVVMTPRYHPWTLVDVPGDERTYVIVLPQTAVTFDAVRGELERVLSTNDPASPLAALPSEQRDAIGRKELVEGMPPRAVEMAWGLPERRRIDRPAATEEWTWPGGRRRAFFQEERVVRWER
jgi:hypothetical protein